MSDLKKMQLLLDEAYAEIGFQIEQAAQLFIDECPDKVEQVNLQTHLFVNVIMHFAQTLPGMTEPHAKLFVEQAFKFLKEKTAQPIIAAKSLN